MTITIIKRVEPTEPTRVIACTTCTSELGYNKSDVKVYAEDRPCGLWQEYIDCPVCNQKIVLSSLSEARRVDPDEERKLRSKPTDEWRLNPLATKGH